MIGKAEKGTKVLLITSYCEDSDNELCSDIFPCDFCLRQANVIEIKDDVAIEVLGSMEHLAKEESKPMALNDLTKVGPSLEADGMIAIYEIGSGKVVAKYEGLEVYEKLLQANMWKKERQLLLQMTNTMDEHPEGYEGPCLCQLCCSYG